MLKTNQIYLGDNLELLKRLDDNSIDSCVSDFPYNLGFMGKKWDTISDYQEWCFQRAKELLRVLKPGGYCLIFGGTRTHHRLVCAFEDAGFDIKDEMQWIYGSGFPKSYNISKGFDKREGLEREVVGKYTHPTAKNGDRTGNKNPYQAEDNHLNGSYDITSPNGEMAKQWEGWGTALKPAQEPIMVAQKPIEKNYCYNIEKWGIGGLNIDPCRIPTTDKLGGGMVSMGRPKVSEGWDRPWMHDSEVTEQKKLETIDKVAKAESLGRWPSNLILDEESGIILDEQSGDRKSQRCDKPSDCGGNTWPGTIQTNRGPRGYDDKGGASRFFYSAKASTKERTENGLVENTHPTVKPIMLIKYLVKLVTPKNGICLDICEGSGTHARACLELEKENYTVNYIGFDNDEESYKISLKRISTVQ
jgi:DNA modification methylase